MHCMHQQSRIPTMYRPLNNKQTYIDTLLQLDKLFKHMTWVFLLCHQRTSQLLQHLSQLQEIRERRGGGEEQRQSDF
jgi:hypothetical protein